MPIGAEEAYNLVNAAPNYYPAAMNELHRGQDQARETQRWFAEENANMAAAPARAFEKGANAAVQQYAPGYERAYSQQIDTANQGRATEEANQRRDLHPLQMEAQRGSIQAQKRAMELSHQQLLQSQQATRAAQAEEDWQNGLDDKTGQTHRVTGYNMGLERDRVGIDAQKAQMRLAQSQAGLAQKEFGMRKEEHDFTMRGNYRDQAQNDLVAAAGQMQAASSAMQRAQNPDALKAAQKQQEDAQRTLDAVQADYRSRGLSPNDFQASLNKAHSDVLKMQRDQASVWKIQGEGQGYEAEKNALDAKVKAYGKLVREAEEYKKAGGNSENAKVHDDNIKRILATELDRPSEAATTGMRAGLPWIAGGEGWGIKSGDARIDEIRQQVGTDIQKQISALETRYGAAPPLAIRQEIDGLKASFDQLKGSARYQEEADSIVQKKIRKSASGLQEVGGLPRTGNGVSSYRRFSNTPVVQPMSQGGVQ